MLNASATVSQSKRASKTLEPAVRKALLDAGQAGVNRSLQEVPHGATSGLAQSAFGPEEESDGSIVWGFSAEYAKYVEEGTRPHWPPIDPLKRWARRVLGEESAAWAVQKKIAAEGTPAQPYVEPGIQAMKAKLNTTGLKGYIQDNL